MSSISSCRPTASPATAEAKAAGPSRTTGDAECADGATYGETIVKEVAAGTSSVSAVAGVAGEAIGAADRAARLTAAKGQLEVAKGARSYFIPRAKTPVDATPEAFRARAQGLSVFQAVKEFGPEFAADSAAVARRAPVATALSALKFGTALGAAFSSVVHYGAVNRGEETAAEGAAGFAKDVGTAAAGSAVGGYVTGTAIRAAMYQRAFAAGGATAGTALGLPGMIGGAVLGTAIGWSVDNALDWYLDAAPAPAPEKAPDAEGPVSPADE